MTTREIDLAATALCGDFTSAFPLPEAARFHRMNVRQREIFSVAADIDPEYFGKCADINIDDLGEIDLRGLSYIDAPVARIDHIVIANTGNYLPNALTPPNDPSYPHRLEAGDRVNIVSAFDQDAHLPPRVMIRDQALIPVGDDLGTPDRHVSRLTIWYQRYPRHIDVDGTVGTDNEVDLESPWDMLLAWDLARYMVTSATGVRGGRKDVLVEMMMAHETALMEQFKTHVAGYSGGARTTRFESV